MASTHGLHPIPPALPPEVAADPEMRGAHAAHAKEMALLRMEIDRARTAAELEQIRALLNQIRGELAVWELWGRRGGCGGVLWGLWRGCGGRAACVVGAGMLHLEAWLLMMRACRR